MKPSHWENFSLTPNNTCSGFDLVHGDIKPENILVLAGYDRGIHQPD